MKKIRKLFAGLIVSVLVLACFSGCGAAKDLISDAWGQMTPDHTVTDTSDEKPKITQEVTPEPTQEESPTPEPGSQVQGEMTVHFLDVGQGLSILVQAEGENLVYDGGGRSASSYTVSYLQRQGVTDIKYLISSHYDEDHVAGLVGCLNAFHVEQVIGADYVQDTKIYESFMNAVTAQGLTVQHPAVGTEYPFGGGKFTILSPASISEDDNRNSVAVRLEYGDSSFLFTGDASAESEASMCASGLSLECDVLSVSHHGSATSTSWEFLQETVPEVAVISCGKDNSYGHPHKDTMDKLEAMGIQVYRTDLQGAVVAVSDGTEIQWDQEPCNDYSPGDSSDQGTQAGSDQGQQPAAETPSATPEPEVPQITDVPEQTVMVWISATGSKYHNKPDCGNMNPNKATQMSESEAQSRGYEPCKKCF